MSQRSSIMPMIALAACLMIALAVPAAGQEASPEPADTGEPAPPTLLEALTGGDATLALRLRYENVDDDGVASGKEAHATTLRTALGYRTLTYRGWDLYLQAENVSSLGNELFNSTRNGVTDRPVVADPTGSELQQAWVRFRPADTTLIAGRQEINIGDHRFVGNVGWRQHHQAFDAFYAENASLERVRFLYAYLDRAHRITRDNKPMASHALNVSGDLGRAGTLTGYGYYLDYDDPADFRLSTSTVGVEWTGSAALGDRYKFLWEAEVATQADAGDNPTEIDAGYLFLMAGGSCEWLTVRAGYEVLEGSPGKGAFSTPLATLHKFNGWADKFLVTPVHGLEDLYLQLSGQAAGIGWLVVYHDFSAENGGGSYGSELDIELKTTTAWKQTFALKGAFYEADGFSRDTTKLWLSTTWGF